ncbi:MAG: efflux RND transporter periplasmic adaptor subunit [Eubacteriales bacterium]|nr:efflux RND transporter periplasmic adaptor subunit [Eubacteriales bacterium]
MKCKKWMSLLLCAAMALTMTACSGKENAVYVQRVGDLMNMGGIAPGDRFAGMVVSENVTEIEKDSDKTIAELKVREGDDVKKDQPLFAYDTEELQLALEKKLLELEQLNASIENFNRQIKDLERERSGASSSEKLQYTVQIQSLQVDLKEAELNVKAKETEVTKAQEILENAVVVAPVAGRIRSINESGTDQNGKALPYIVIQQAGAYRVKGTLGELQRGGIVEGDKMRILSRTDSSQVWTGSVTLVDYESPVTGDQNSAMIMGSSPDEMTSSSKYPFYVELDSTEGLLLGQHVYLELDTGDQETKAGISSAFLVYEEDGTTSVWAESKGKLEKRTVTLGEYNSMNDTYEILEGLTEEDYIAFPDPELCQPGAPTTHEYVAPETEAPEAPMEGAMEGGVA